MMTIRINAFLLYNKFICVHHGLLNLAELILIKTALPYKPNMSYFILFRTELPVLLDFLVAVV